MWGDLHHFTLPRQRQNGWRFACVHDSVLALQPAIHIPTVGNDANVNHARHIINGVDQPVIADAHAPQVEVVISHSGEFNASMRTRVVS